MYSEMTILHTTGGGRESVEYVHLVEDSDQWRGEISGSMGTSIKVALLGCFA